MGITHKIQPDDRLFRYLGKTWHYHDLLEEFPEFEYELKLEELRELDVGCSLSIIPRCSCEAAWCTRVK